MTKKYYKTENRRAYFQKMNDLLGGVCMICKQPERLVIDHDHKTGEMRGLLCYSHNAGLGMFQDSPELLESAARYLREQRPTMVTASKNKRKYDEQAIIDLLKNRPNEPQSSLARDYSSSMGCSLDCAKARISRVARKHGYTSPYIASREANRVRQGEARICN